MLTVIANGLVVVAVIVGIIAFLRSRAPKYHDISAAEIHPDLAAADELLRDALDETQSIDRRH